MGDTQKTQRTMREALTSVNNFIETNPYMRLSAYVFHFFGLAVLIATGYQIMVQLSERSREILVREAAHKHVLRESLFSPIPGSSGKGAALQELLMLEGAGLRGLDLSCKRVGGNWHETKLTCQNPVVLWDIDFREIYDTFVKRAQEKQVSAGVIEHGIGMDRLNFAGVHAHGDFSYLASEKAVLTSAQFENSILLRSTIEGDFQHFNCKACDLTSAELRGKFDGAMLDHAAISSASFGGNLKNASWMSSWAWADSLPLAISPIDQRNNDEHSSPQIDPVQQFFLLQQIQICDPSKRIKFGLESNSSVREIESVMGFDFKKDCSEISMIDALTRYAENNSEIVSALKKRKSEE